MKKILIILIGITVSNITFAGLIQIFYPNKYRCKITYTQLSLKTNIEKTVTITVQQENPMHRDKPTESCSDGIHNLKYKIIDWQREYYTNIVTSIGAVSCKIRDVNWFQNVWSDYGVCDKDSHNMFLIYELTHGEPALQTGYNVHIDRIIGLLPE